MDERVDVRNVNLTRQAAWAQSSKWQWNWPAANGRMKESCARTARMQYAVEAAADPETAGAVTNPGTLLCDDVASTLQIGHIAHVA